MRVLLLAVLVGCGGDTERGQPSDPPPCPGEACGECIEEAGRLCAAADGEWQRACQPDCQLCASVHEVPDGICTDAVCGEFWSAECLDKKATYEECVTRAERPCRE